MTATPATTAPPAATGYVPGTTRRAARALLPIASGQAIWWWLVAPVLFGILPALQPPWLDDLTMSLWQFVLYAPIVVSFSMGAVLVAVHLPLYVMGGIDRRSFTVGAALAGLPAMVASAGVAAAGYALERATLVSAVAEPTLVEGHLYTTTDQYGLVVVEMLLAIATAWVTGWLVSVGYYRLGWLRGTLLLPASFLPATVVYVAVTTARIPGTSLVPGTAARVVIAIVIVAMTRLVADRATRGLELRGTTTWLVTG